MTKKSRSVLIAQAQQIATEVSEGANTASRIGGMDNDIVDSMKHLDDPAEFTSVDERYADIAAMIAAQGSQVSKNIYYVVSAAADGIIGYAYYEYNGGTAGTLADYNLISAEIMGVVDVTPQSTPPPHNEARFFYDDVKKNFIFYNDRTSVSMDLGRELWTRAINKTGSGTTNGKAVYIDGASGDLPEVKFAKADTEATSQVLGLCTEDIAIDDNGEITGFGLINGVATDSWAAGDLLYISAATAGELTNVKPTVPNFEISVGYVVKSHASEGIIWANVGHIEPPIHRSISSAWSSFSGSTTVTNYLQGYYTFAVSSFTPSGTPQTFGTANISYGAHVYFVLGAASTDMIIRVSGTSFDDATGRTAADTEDVDTSGGSTDDYFETSKKWIGQVSITLQSGTGAIVDYGFDSYWDNRNTDFVISSLEWVGRAGANDSSPNLRLWHHKSTGWTYTGSGATPPTPLVDMQTELVTEYQFATGQMFKFKVIGLSQPVSGTLNEGLIIGIDITANNAVANSNVEMQIIGS